MSFVDFGSGLLRRTTQALRFPNRHVHVFQTAVRNGDLTLHDIRVAENTVNLVQIPGGVFRTWHLRGAVGRPARDACQLLSTSGKILPVSGSDHASEGSFPSRVSSFVASENESSLQIGFCLEPWYGNFYHWLIWCTPRLLLLHRGLGISLFYFPCGASRNPFIVQTFELLGLNVDSIVEVPVGFHLTRSIAAVQNFTPHSLFYSLIARRALANPACCRAVTSLRGCFLVRREGVNNPRVLLNEVRIIAICQEYGLTPIDPASLDLSEQIRLFSSVPLLVGVHGAALSNMVWMPKASQVLEIMVDDAQHFKSLAAQVGHHWLGILSEPQSTLGCSSNFSVNPEIFKFALEMALCQL